jgi:hypothetical protein
MLYEICAAAAGERPASMETSAGLAVLRGNDLLMTSHLTRSDFTNCARTSLTTIAERAGGDQARTKPRGTS